VNPERFTSDLGCPQSGSGEQHAVQGLEFRPASLAPQPEAEETNRPAQASGSSLCTPGIFVTATLDLAPRFSLLRARPRVEYTAHDRILVPHAGLGCAACGESGSFGSRISDPGLPSYAPFVRVDRRRSC
jgi:hypothetical protein